MLISYSFFVQIVFKKIMPNKKLTKFKTKRKKMGPGTPRMPKKKMGPPARDKKRGKFHYDSSIYPYICTAVIKGKWNYYRRYTSGFRKYGFEP